MNNESKQNAEILKKTLAGPSGLNETPRGSRVHIALFGRRNSGKSSLINALTGQDIALVSDTPGTTTDPVFKAMELHPVGPVVFIDTAGFDDEGELGEKRIARSKDVVRQTDIALLMLDERDESTDGAGDAEHIKSDGAPDAESRKADGAPDAEQTKTDGAPDAEQAKADGAPDGERGNEDGAPKADSKEDKPSNSSDLYAARWMDMLKKADVPVIRIRSKMDLDGMAERYPAEADAKRDIIQVSAVTGQGIDEVRAAIAAAAAGSQSEERKLCIGTLAQPGDVVLLVMPQNIQAPKGRLILPQVQTIRELLDASCTAICTDLTALPKTLAALKDAPDLIITDSQCFEEVYKLRPEGSRLTSFSVLMAGLKGDIRAFVEGADAIDHLTEDSKVLIAEACTHAPLTEDIGREQIPAKLRRRTGEGLTVDVVAGKDFPEDLTGYDLIIHCGACMFNRRHVMSRMAQAERAGVPMTNYGIAIAKLAGILDKVDIPEYNED